MSNQPPYGYPGQQGGGYPPPGAATGKTKVLNLDYNIAAMLAYLPICCVGVISSVIWIATEPKENRLLRFHAMQSLFLSGATIAAFFILWVVQIVAGRIFFAFGLVVLLVELALSAVCLILFIMGCVKGYQGQMWKIPVIGDMAEKNC
jgi:uncharacterized membrane protein